MHAAMKLGRNAPTEDQKKRALPLAKYLTKPLPAAPPTFYGSRGAAIGMWANDRYGLCTIAAAANLRAVDAVREGRPTPPTSDDAVIAEYFDMSGGQDSGLVEHDVLDRWASKGLRLGGDAFKLAAWVSVDRRDTATVKSLISTFWGLYIGAQLPIAAQNQDRWDVDPTSLIGAARPGSWGGHAMGISDYDETDYGLITWGMVKQTSSPWVDVYVDELYLPLDADRASMANVDWPALVSDMQAVTQ